MVKGAKWLMVDVLIFK